MKAIIVISGFTEKDHEQTGSFKLWDKLRYRYAGEDCVVLLKEWNEDWKSFASQLKYMGVTRVQVNAYSWGAGYGLKELAKYHRFPIFAVLCDPVYYSKWITGRWRALLVKTRKLLGGVIKYNDNVRVREWFNQVNNTPRGDKVKAFFMPDNPITLDCTHGNIDDSCFYHNAAIDEAKRYLSQ